MLDEYQKKKIGQIIHRIAARHTGARISYIKTLKLLYIIDREALKKWHFTITEDNSYCALKNGPVLEDTMDLIKTERISDDILAQYVKKDSQKRIVSVAQCDYDELSDIELQHIDKIVKRYKSRSVSQMIELTHTFPEWKQTGGSKISISIKDITRAITSTAQDASRIEKNAENDACLSGLFA